MALTGNIHWLRVVTSVGHGVKVFTYGSDWIRLSINDLGFRLVSVTEWGSWLVLMTDWGPLFVSVTKYRVLNSISVPMTVLTGVTGSLRSGISKWIWFLSASGISLGPIQWNWVPSGVCPLLPASSLTSGQGPNVTLAGPRFLSSNLRAGPTCPSARPHRQASRAQYRS